MALDTGAVISNVKVPVLVSRAKVQCVNDVVFARDEHGAVSEPKKPRIGHCWAGPNIAVKYKVTLKAPDFYTRIRINCVDGIVRTGAAEEHKRAIVFVFPKGGG